MRGWGERRGPLHPGLGSYRRAGGREDWGRLSEKRSKSESRN